jgi:hypothetical protein
MEDETDDIAFINIIFYILSYDKRGGGIYW